MEQTNIEKNIDKKNIREIIDRNTELLKKSGALPENYPYHKGSKPYELLRSALVEYKEKYNMDFTIPAGSVIIEDI